VTPADIQKVGDPTGQLLSSADRKRSRGSGRPLGDILLPYGLLLPILAFEIVLVIYPIFRGGVMAFQSNHFGVTRWAGLDNFNEMLNDPTFWQSVEVTLKFTFSMVVVWLLLGLCVALLMNWSFKGRGLMRALLMLPWAIPDLPIIVTFSIMLDPNFGVVNRFASWIPGVHHQIFWLSDSNLAFIAIVGMVGWKGFPFYALILLSSLQAIPEDLYEAARVDGSSTIRAFWSITMPALVPTLSLLGVLAFIFSFQQFSLIYLTTGGGPGNDTSTLAVTIYNEAFEFFNYNYATALAIVALILAICATLVYVLFERTVIRDRYLDVRNTAL
jgi:multiple sugar transport system permease protein